MSVSQTHGYHLVFEIDGTRVARILDDFIPNPISFAVGSFTATASAIPGRPSTVTIAAGNALTINAVRAISIAGNTVNVRITIQAAVNTNASGQISITYPATPTIVTDTPADQNTLQNLVNLANIATGTSLTVAQALQMGAAQLLTTLQSGFALPAIPIGVPIGTGPCALSLSRADLHSISGSLFILLKFSGAGIPPATTNANAFTASLRGSNHAVMLVGNEALLAIATCFIANDPSSPLQGTIFNTSGTCSTLLTPHSVSLDGHDILVSALSICVSGNNIVVSGGAATSGTGWSATATFSAPIGFSCHSDGTVFPIFDPNSVAISTDVSFDWWVYVVGFLLAAIAGVFLGPIAAIVLSIVVACLSAIASMIANSIARNALSGLQDSLNSAVASGFRMLPQELLQILGDLQCQSVILDDFSMLGTTGNPGLPDIYMYESADHKTSQVQIGSGGSGFQQWVDYQVAHSVVYTATASFFKSPQTMHWYINNIPVSGSGSMSLNGKSITYQVSGNTCTVNTQVGDNVAGVIAARATGGNGFSKMATEIINISGTYRDYPMQDAIQAIMAKVAKMMPIQGIPFPGPGPDPGPEYQWTIDTQQNFSQAALHNSTVANITSTPEFNKQLNALNQMAL